MATVLQPYSAASVHRNTGRYASDDQSQHANLISIFVILPPSWLPGKPLRCTTGTVRQSASAAADLTWGLLINRQTDELTLTAGRTSSISFHMQTSAGLIHPSINQSTDPSIPCHIPTNNKCTKWPSPADGIKILLVFPPTRNSISKAIRSQKRSETPNLRRERCCYLARTMT